MATSRKTGVKTNNVTHFPAPENSVAVEDRPTEEATPATDEAIPATPAAAPAASPPPPRPKADGPRESNFFQRVASVSPAEWGTRVYLYLYQLEPVCDLKQSGGKAYLMRYQEPVRDEHQIMLEQGSGKYRLVLALNKISPQASNELARYDFEIYNPQYPPKVPQEVWIKDPRNRRWEALLPKPAPVPRPGAVTGVSDFVEVLRATNEIRRDIRDEMQPPAAAPAAPLAAAPAADPFVSAMGLAKEILQMRTSENPMVDILRDELKAMREELRDERAENRRLQTAAPAVAPQKSFIEQALEFAGAAEKLKPLAAAFGFTPAANGTGEVVRSGKTTLIDLAREVLPEIVNSDLAKGIGYKLMSSATSPAAPAPVPIQVNGAPQPNQQQIDEFAQFMQTVVTPAVLTAIEAGDSGAEFAEWMERGFGTERLQQLQNFSHPMLPGLKGEHAIISGFQHTKAWEYLSKREEQFRIFVREFCQWNPDQEEGAAPAAEPSQSVDFDAEFEKGANA